MPFFKSKPNLDDNKKAKVEFYFFQIGKALGWKRCIAPIVPATKLLDLGEHSDPLTALVSFLSEHLQHERHRQFAERLQFRKTTDLR